MVFVARDVVRLSGLSYRQVDHLLRTGVFRLGRAAGPGRGCPRQFSLREVLALALARDMLQAGLSPKVIATALRFVQRAAALPPLEELGAATMWTDGLDVVVSLDGAAETRPLSKPVAHVIDLGSASRRVMGALAAMTGVAA